LTKFAASVLIAGMTTIATVQADLLANVDFAETNSIVKAKAFISACKKFRILNPTSSSNGGTSVAYDINQVATMQTQAESFVRSNDSPSGRVRFLSVSDDFR
jgi:hypothetical protein